VIAQGDAILLKDLPPEIREAAPAGEPAVPAMAPLAAPAEPPAAPGEPPAPEPAAAAPALSLQEALDFVYTRLKAESAEPVLERLEREMIERVLRDEHGNLVRASERLGITRTTLRKRIDALGLKV